MWDPASAGLLTDNIKGGRIDWSRRPFRLHDPMDKYPRRRRSRRAIDRDALRFGITKLRRSDIYALLDRAIGVVPGNKLADLFAGYVDVRALPTGGRTRRRTGLVAAVRAFEAASLRRDHYDPFDVNSKNFTETSDGTSAWIAECGRLFERCIEESSQQAPAEACQSFEIMFGLLRFLNSDPDRIVFFADEGGAWQVDVAWADVLKAWFHCLAATATPGDYARKVVDVIDEFDRHNRARHLATARRAATQPQRAALRALDQPSASAGARRRRTARDRSRG